jgi:putative transposase
MTQRHSIQYGHIMLVTTVLKDRRKLFYNPAFAREAVECLYRTMEIHPVFLHGFAVMPDHIHLLIHPIEPMNVSLFMNRYKTNISRSISIGPIWQRRFHVRIANDAFAALDYIHHNPCLDGLCDSPDQYPWSSASGMWDVSPLD